MISACFLMLFCLACKSVPKIGTYVLIRVLFTLLCILLRKQHSLASSTYRRYSQLLSLLRISSARLNRGVGLRHHCSKVTAFTYGLRVHTFMSYKTELSDFSCPSSVTNSIDATPLDNALLSILWWPRCVSKRSRTIKKTSIHFWMTFAVAVILYYLEK